MKVYAYKYKMKVFKMRVTVQQCVWEAPLR